MQQNFLMQLCCNPYLYPIPVRSHNNIKTISFKYFTILNNNNHKTVPYQTFVIFWPRTYPDPYQKLAHDNLN